MKKVNQALAVALLILSPSSLLAVSSDRAQPIQVEADKLEVRDDDNISTYSGNVRLIQGSLRIRSDLLVIHFDDNNDLVLMEMTGTPATFRQLNNDNQEMLGQADKMNYREAESLLILQGNACFNNNGDTIESSTIRINTENDHIEAVSPEPDQRVNVIIQPKNKRNLNGSQNCRSIKTTD